MLATFGLERLEAGLVENTVTATDVAEFLAQAEPGDMRTLAREGMPEALDCLHRRLESIGDAEMTTDRLLAAAVVSGPDHADPSRQWHNHSRANRQFGPPQHANRV
ncbi:MAG TPA: hypothetical protein VIO95_15980 [Mycobacterium sp.]